MSSTDSSDSNSSKGSINSTGERANEVDSLGNDPEMQQDSEPRGETRNKKSQERSLEEEEEEKELSFKRTRFEATGEDAHSNWEFPDEMLKYARKQFNFYIKEKDLKDSVCWKILYQKILNRSLNLTHIIMNCWRTKGERGNSPWTQCLKSSNLRFNKSWDH